MIKEAIAYITNLAVQAEKPEVLEINGRTYCTKNMTRYDKADMADPIKATTLTSLVDYIKQRRDELREHMIIQVVSATEVRMYSGLLDERDRSMTRRASSSPCSRVSRITETARLSRCLPATS